VFLSVSNAAQQCYVECELQNSVNHRNFERKWRFPVPPGSMSLRVASPPASARAPRVASGFRPPAPLWRSPPKCARCCAPRPLPPPLAGVLLSSVSYTPPWLWPETTRDEGSQQTRGAERRAVRLLLRSRPSSLCSTPKRRALARVLSRPAIE